MPPEPSPNPQAQPAFLPARTVVIALFLFDLAVIARTLAWYSNEPEHQARFPWMLGFELIYLALAALYFLRPARSAVGRSLYFGFQSIFVLVMFILQPTMDFVTAQYLLLSYQAGLQFSGRARWIWITGLLLLTCIPSMVFGDPIRGLALQLSTMAGMLVLAAYVAALQEEEAARIQNQAILAELQETNHHLQLYSVQVEELAALKERNRLALEIHDSVSQTMFSMMLNVRAARLFIERDPANLSSQLETLQALSQSALAEMRSLISQLRPKAG